MQTIAALSELPRIADPVLRDWVDARWRGALADGAEEVIFHLLEPAEPPIPCLSAALGNGTAALGSLDALVTVAEYLVEHRGRFIELVLLPTNESAIVALIPAGHGPAPPWLDDLRHAAQPAVPVPEALPHTPNGVSHDATPQSPAGDPPPAARPSGRDPVPDRAGSEGDPDPH